MTRIAHWFRDLPIERKLSTITTCVVLAALLPFAGVTLAYEYLTVRRAKVQEVQVQANIIRDNTAAALAFRDASFAHEVLDTLRASPGIVQAVLTLPDGSVLAHYVRPPLGATPRHPPCAMQSRRWSRARPSRWSDRSSSKARWWAGCCWRATSAPCTRASTCMRCSSP